MFDYKQIFRLMRSGYDIQPAKTLADIPENVEVLHVTRNTLALERLSKFPNLRVLNAHDIGDDHFSQICRASQITYLSANIFSINNLQELRNLEGLQGLELTDNTKIVSLNALESLTKLKVFALANCPVTVDIDPISACKDLSYLWLSSSYEKPMRINSLLPLSGLTQLERLKFANVRIDDQKLAPLYNLVNLIEVELPNFFPRKEFVDLGNALPNARGRWIDKHTGRR